jgi:hypothetical protein
MFLFPLNEGGKIQKSATLKGTGTRDYIRLKVFYFDSSWFGESPAEIHNF